MDKTIEIVLVAVVVVFAAAIAMFLVAGESSNFGNFIGNQTDDSECELLLTQGNYQEADEQGCDTSDASCQDLGHQCYHQAEAECDGNIVSGADCPSGGGTQSCCDGNLEPRH